MAEKLDVETDVDAGSRAGVSRGRGRPPGSVVVTDEDLRAIVKAHPDWGVGRIAKAAGLSESWTRQRLRGMGLHPGVGAGAGGQDEPPEEELEKAAEEPENASDPLLDRFRLLLHDELDPLVQALRLDKPASSGGSEPAEPVRRGSGWGVLVVVMGVVLAAMAGVWTWQATRRSAPSGQAVAAFPPLVSQRSRFPRAG